MSPRFPEERDGERQPASAILVEPRAVRSWRRVWEGTAADSCRKYVNLEGYTRARLRLFGDWLEGTEIYVEDLPVANDVPFRQDREATLREPGRLNIEFLVGFEMIGEFA